MHPELHHLLYLQREAEVVRDAERRRLVAERSEPRAVPAPHRHRRRAVGRRRAWRATLDDVLHRAARTDTRRHQPAR